MKIRYFGHSCFQFESANGTLIVADPYDGSIGYALPHLEADVVTVSHGHFDHNYVSAVRGNPAILNEVGSWRVGGVEIDAIGSFHDDAHGAKRGENLVFEYLIDGVSVCHFGDLGEACMSALTDKIRSVDALLIPVGGNYTIDAVEAKKYVDVLKPSFVIPMHFKTADLNIDIATLDAFLKLFNASDIVRVGSEFTLSDEKSAGGKPKVIVMERARI